MNNSQKIYLISAIFTDLLQITEWKKLEIFVQKREKDDRRGKCNNFVLDIQCSRGGPRANSEAYG